MLWSWGSTAPREGLSDPYGLPRFLCDGSVQSGSSPVFTDGKRRTQPHRFFLGLDSGAGDFSEPGQGAIRSCAFTPGKGFWSWASIMSIVNSNMEHLSVRYEYFAGIQNVIWVKYPFSAFSLSQSQQEKAPCQYTVPLQSHNANVLLKAYRQTNGFWKNLLYRLMSLFIIFFSYPLS